MASPTLNAFSRASKGAMGADQTTRRIRRLDALRRGLAGSIHAAREIAIPSLRGQRDHSTIISSATYSPWRVDKSFLDVYTDVRDNTLLDELRMYELWQLADQVRHLDGDAIEIGCWRGGAGCLVAKRIFEAQKDSTVFLCDTFSGVVKASGRDSAYRGGEHGDSDVALVEDLARRLGLSNIVILKGMFPEDTGEQVADRKFKFAHIDVDVYQGARDAFDWLMPRLLVGAIVVFDDYGSSQTNGIRSFIDELHGSPDFAIIRNVNGQATAVRRANLMADGLAQENL